MCSPHQFDLVLANFVDQFPARASRCARIILAAVIAHVNHHGTGTPCLLQDPGDLAVEGQRIGDRLRREQHVSPRVAGTEWALVTLSGRFATVIWVPGNHDRTTLHDAVRFEEVSFGYPREWQRRGREPGLRQILPLPDGPW